MTSRRLALVVVAVAMLAPGCGSDGGSNTPGDAGPFTTTLHCPALTSVPFVLDDTAWAFSDNEMRVQTQPRHKHQPADIVGTPGNGYALTLLPGDAPMITGNERIEGVMARTEENRGLFADAVAAETVSLWQYDDTAGWTQLGEQTTGDFSSDSPGGYSFELSSPPPEGITTRYAVLNPEPSCGTHTTYILPTGTKVVVADIDGTMTLSDDELIMQISDGMYDPAEMMGSVALSQAWAAKGYQMVYLTARPHMFRTETRRWLVDHGYADGPIITAPMLVSGDAARTYKRDWVNRLQNDLGWVVVAAYGNAQSDIDAYGDAGIDKGVTFIVGDNAGVDGTTAIANDDYTTHIADYVMNQPDA